MLSAYALTRNGPERRGPAEDGGGSDSPPSEQRDQPNGGISSLIIETVEGVE